METCWTSFSAPRGSACRRRCGRLEAAGGCAVGQVVAGVGVGGASRHRRTLSGTRRLLTAAMRFYAGQLRRSPEARKYLASRGIGAGAARPARARIRAGERS